MHQTLHISEIATPYLVGKHLHTILPIITQHNLNLRLIDQKEEIDLPEGIILNQSPAAGTIIKQNQPIFIVTAKKRPAILAPSCIGHSLAELKTPLLSQGISARVYYLPHIYPEQHCFAQSPSPNESLEHNKIILYVSVENNKPIIWPDFTHIPLQDVLDFLDYYHIKPYIINNFPLYDTNSYQYKVIDQRPSAGTLLTLDEQKPLSVQIRIDAIG